jgi:hypothetical protein
MGVYLRGKSWYINFYYKKGAIIIKLQVCGA